MKRILLLVLLLIATLSSKAQKTTYKEEPYGRIDTSDINLKSCDFEPEANAEVLFDKGVIENGLLTRHVRTKVFNQHGVGQANVRLFFVSYTGSARVEQLKAETINIEDGKKVITPVNSSQIFNQRVDNFISLYTFTFPDVKPGSIIEYEYTIFGVLDWNFQTNVPTRYSEIQAHYPPAFNFRMIPHVDQPFVINDGGPLDNFQDKALINIHSLPEEPFMDSRASNLQRMEFLDMNTGSNTWQKIADILLRDNNLTGQFDKKLLGEDSILAKAKGITSQEAKISFVFTEVKQAMKWNGHANYVTEDGIVTAWNKKTGNSAEINLILYDLLHKSGIDAYPILISTKSHGKINPVNPNLYSFNSLFVYVPIDTTDAENSKYYVLDATDKYNLYNLPPKEGLNTFGVVVDKANHVFKPTFIEDRAPSQQSVFINAEIKPDAKMEGTAEISSSGYNRIEQIARYKTAGEKKFTDTLRNNDNDMKIISLKLQNMDTDSLPLVQNVTFSLNLSASDADYIYFNPNLFITPHNNPFLNENRFSDIDFGYKNNAGINGVFKTPDGYKIYSVPKNTILIMPDTSIIFRRTINQQDDQISVRYTITYKKTTYFKKDYPPFYQFYKKMYELLNEQIVLKKS